MEKEKEVYVDFSDADSEVIEEEVIQSGPTEANIAPSGLAKYNLPPVVIEYAERLQESYNQYRKQYLIALGILGIVILVAIVAALLFLGGDGGSSGSDTITNAKQETFVVGPITVPFNHRYDDIIEDIPRPPGNIALHEVEMSVVDSKNQSVPLYTIYNHHAIIYNYDNIFVAGVGAESAGVPGLKASLPYVVHVGEDESWYMYSEFINVWGTASGADYDIYVRYTVTYSDYDEEKHVPIAWTIVGDGSDHYDVENCEHPKGDTCKFVFDETWTKDDCTLVSVVGHVHIGAINITLDDVTKGETIAVAFPVYDESGDYIISVNSDFASTYEITKGTKLRVTSYYDRTQNYKGVMSLFQIWGTFPPEILYSDSEAYTSSSAITTYTSYQSDITETESEYEYLSEEADTAY